jgi:hypothetical protein
MDINKTTEQIIGAAIEVHRVYLRIGSWKVGLIINFNVPILKNGIRRRVL